VTGTDLSVRPLGDEQMTNDNPLKPVAIPLFVISVLVLPWQIRAGMVDLFAVISLIGSAILVVLYLRKSKHAAAFLFWSTVPIYPLYFLSIALGQSAAPTNANVYVVLAAIWIGGLASLWRLKAKYAAFLTATVVTASVPSS
jgi:hypothetical protein